MDRLDRYGCFRRELLSVHVDLSDPPVYRSRVSPILFPRIFPRRVINVSIATGAVVNTGDLNARKDTAAAAAAAAAARDVS